MKIRSPRWIVALLVMVVGVQTLYFGLHLYILHRQNALLLEPGIQYAAFKKPLEGVAAAGFLTNQDMSPEKNEGGFLQAQYILAPTILELNNPNHTYNILDFTDQIYVFYMIKKFNFKRVADTEWAKVLVKRQ